MNLNFSDLKTDNSGYAKEIDTTKIIIKETRRINFNQDILKIQPKKKKEELRLIEPGVKIGTGQFLTIGQWCNTCQEVQGHAHKPEKRKLICLICKTIKTY